MPQVDANGRIIPDPVGPAHSPEQHITGSPLQAAVATTMADRAASIEAAHSLGAGQKAGRRHRGGANEASVPKLPEAGTMGTSFEKAFMGIHDLKAQLHADAAGDKLAHAPPVQVHGSGRKSRRKVNGIRHKRTHRRKHHRHTSRRSRVRRVHSRRR